MCYDVAAGTKSALKYAKHRGDDPDIVRELEKQLDLWLSQNETNFHVSGFAHPTLMVFTNEKAFLPQSYIWGLIPNWIKDSASAIKLMRQTLNARAETIFEKPSFRSAARSKRCLVYIDGFYEYHHYQKKAYPVFISMKDDSPMSLAGLWDTWLDKSSGEVLHTVSIITTKANALMAHIHNKPLSEDSRMPVILPKAKQDEWIGQAWQDGHFEALQKLLIPFPEDELRCYTVRKLKGKDAPGNKAAAMEKFVYPELEGLPG